MRFTPILACLVLLLTALPVRAASDVDHRAIARATLDGFILPAYGDLEATSEILNTALNAYCENGTDPRPAYQDMMDAWQKVQAIRVGPVLDDNRFARLQFWPDARNLTARHLRQLFNEKDWERLSESRFSETSIAVQGLWALERLFFDEEFQEETAARDDYYCAYLQSVGGNLVTITSNVLAAWEDADSPVRQAWDAPSEDNPMFHTPVEVTQSVAGIVTDGVEAVVLLKLDKPMGKSVDRPRPRLAENWRSERSLRNIRLNLAAARSLYEVALRPAVLDYPDGDELDESIAAGFASAAQLTDDLGRELDVSPDHYSRLQLLRTQLEFLHKTLAGPMAGVLGLGVSFNSLDGD